VANAVENIWEEWNERLKTFILKRVSDETLADDILQDVFVRIQSKIQTVRDIHKIRPWVFQITRNAVIDHYRTRKFFWTLPDERVLGEESENGELLDELTFCVDNMVEKLPEKYRRAVKMTVYQGMTQKEMGERLGISFSGAKSRAQRAREKLKGMMHECCDFELDCLGNVIAYEPKIHLQPTGTSRHTFR